MQRVSYDQISSILLVVVAIIALWKTRGLSEMSYIFPRTIGIILLMLSIIYLIFSYLRRENKKLFHNIDKKFIKLVTIILLFLFMIDFAFYLIKPNQGNGISSSVSLIIDDFSTYNYNVNV